MTFDVRLFALGVLAGLVEPFRLLQVCRGIREGGLCHQ
jgi:hypothetical protein